ncbi:hypothetical protein [Megasphaera sp.]|uniref:hypothetical protein n=1 Tax=Megasphaera sp. TaxID=2023260 RepID=UPI003F7E6A22
MKNSEGYPDPTAGKAMANIRKDDRRADLVLQIIKAVCKLAGYRMVCTRRNLKILEIIIRRQS